MNETTKFAYRDIRWLQLPRYHSTTPRKRGAAMKIPAEAIPYIEMQRAECRGEDVAAKYAEAMGRDALAIAEVLDIGAAELVVDIGCGVAGLTAWLATCMPVPRIHLVDRTEAPEKRFYGFRKRACFYNSLDVARAVVEANCRASVTTQEATDDRRIEVADGAASLVVSTLAIGFHEPLAGYLPEILRVLGDEGALVVDLRRGTGQEALILETFSCVDVVAIGAKHIRLVCRR